MADVLAEGLAWLADQLLAHAARPVEYRRGGQAALVSAVIGRSQTARNDGQDVTIEWTERDYLIPASLLVLGTQTITPQRGDRIIDNGETWEVLATPQHPGWRTSDPYGVLWRISTKRVPA